ncbi:hypothetical protein [Paenibacillus sp. FSL K6-2524]
MMDEAEQLFNYSRVFNVYELTEAGPRVSAQTITDKNCYSAGKAIKNVRV